MAFPCRDYSYCLYNMLTVKSVDMLSGSNVRMTHCKSLIGHFPECYLCSVACQEIKYSNVLCCLSVWCAECWIVKFTARCLLRCGTQESTGVSAFTPARGDKRLSFRKVYHRVINKNQQWWKAPACFSTLIKYLCCIRAYVSTVTFELSPADNPIITLFSLLLLTLNL